MNNIQNELEDLRQWFLNHQEFTESNVQLLKSKFISVLDLLLKGSTLGLNIMGIRFSSIHEFLSTQLPRIEKILNPNGIILTSDMDKTVEELYGIICSVVIVQLANPTVVD
jgi:hypothetical protein